MPELIDQQRFLNEEFSVIDFDVQTVDLPMHVPMKLSFETYTHRPSAWVTLSCRIGDTAIAGFGEGTTLPTPLFTDDSGENIGTHATELARSLVGREVNTVGGALERTRMHSFGTGTYPSARLAVEMAIMDASSKAADISVRELVGVSPSITEVPYGKSIGGTTALAIVDQTEKALEQNARKIKLKVAPDIFTEVMRAIHVIRDTYPEVDLMVDGNGGFNPADKTHRAMLRELDGAKLVMIEEPVSRLGERKGLAAVRVLREELGDLQTPVCLDDCLQDYSTCETALREGLADIVNVKPGRIGSFLQSLDLVDFAVSLSKEVMVGGMFEATPGRCMTTVLAAYCLEKGFTIPGDISLPQERLSADLVQADKQLHLGPSGGVILPEGKGWGF